MNPDIELIQISLITIYIDAFRLSRKIFEKNRIFIFGSVPHLDR